jgi:hypothetical protein
MILKQLPITVGLMVAAFTCGALAQQDEKLGKLSFPTSSQP